MFFKLKSSIWKLILVQFSMKPIDMQQATHVAYLYSVTCEDTGEPRDVPDKPWDAIMITMFKRFTITQWLKMNFCQNYMFGSLNNI